MIEDHNDDDSDSENNDDVEMGRSLRQNGENEQRSLADISSSDGSEGHQSQASSSCTDDDEDEDDIDCEDDDEDEDDEDEDDEGDMAHSPLRINHLGYAVDENGLALMRQDSGQELDLELLDHDDSNHEDAHDDEEEDEDEDEVGDLHMIGIEMDLDSADSQSDDFQMDMHDSAMLTHNFSLADEEDDDSDGLHFIYVHSLFINIMANISFINDVDLIENINGLIYLLFIYR